MTEEYQCSECDETVSVRPHQDIVKCPHCKAMLQVARDGEFVDGMWRNLTTVNTIPE